MSPRQAYFQRLLAFTLSSRYPAYSICWPDGMAPLFREAGSAERRWRTSQRLRQVAILAWLLVPFAARQGCTLAQRPGQEPKQGLRAQGCAQFPWLRRGQEGGAADFRDCDRQGQGWRQLCHRFAKSYQPSTQGLGENEEGHCRQKGKSGSVEQLGG